MTLFEYVAAGYVLILSFAVLRAVSGVPYAVRPGRRYWVHVLYLSLALATCLVGFWAFWFYREVEWTFFRFSVALAVPVLLYVYVSLLVPPDPSAVTSWRDHFFGVRIPLFSSGILMFIAVAISTQTILGVPSLHPSQWPTYAAIALYAIGLTSAKPSLHTALAFALPCIFAVVFLAGLGQGDAFALPAP